MSTTSPASFAPSRHDDTDAPYREPLSPWMRRGLLAAVIFFHVGAGWALTQVEPAKIVVGDTPPMEVRMVSAEQPDMQVPVPPPEDTPPPEFPPEPQMESMIQPPPPDLPPPVFPIQAPPAPPPKPRPPPPRPQVPQTASPAPAAPQPAAPQPMAPTAPAGPIAVSVSQVSFRVRPNPIYPAHSRRMNEQGAVMLNVVVDTAGRPTNVTIAKSSGHPALDESALSAVRACQFNPYIAGGVAHDIAVTVPINFVLQ